MFLLVGLGNPGSNYAFTRHNAGFLFLDYLAELHNFSWSKKGKFDALLSSAKIFGQEVLFCKPQSFMNLSGQAVLAVASFYKLPAEKIIVIHDDLDFAFGRIGYKFGGGAGGHNGLKSIDKLLGPNYHRIRIGIGRPIDLRHDIADFVLQNFTQAEADILSDKFKLLEQNLSLLFDGKIEPFKQNLTAS